MPAPQAHSTNSAPAALLGAETPRLWTPPLRDLTPETSYGYDVIDFADTIGLPLDPWQRWLAIHVGELLPDNRPRFRTALILVARQNGKTTLAKVFALYWMFIEQVPLVLGTSTNRDYARAVWRDLCNTAQTTPILTAELGKKPVWSQTGSEELITAAGSRYKFAATNRKAGRSLTVHRLLLDELREHHDFSAWSAATNAGNAVPDFQCIAITNQGDHRSVVLDHLRHPAIAYIETGQGDPRLGLFEWSAPDGADPRDPAALAAANPNLGHRVDPDALLGAATRAKAAGGEELAQFRTEVLCQRVHLLDPAIDPDRWHQCAGTIANLAEHRDKVALCVDLSLDGRHACLVAAALINGRVHVDVVKAWDGYGTTAALRRDLPAIVRRVRPRTLGWFPAGPAASVAAELADRGHRDWPPRRVTVEAIRGDVTSVCMGLAEQVTSAEIIHPDDPMLNAHIDGATRLWRGDGWVFTRRGAAPVDGAYAAAGAVHLARTLPPAPPPLVVLT